MTARRWRVAVVTSHPIQYQAPWFRALARLLDLVVFFCHRQDAHGQAAAGFDTNFEWDISLLDGYSHQWLDNRSADPNVFTYNGCDTPDVDRALGEGRFDACIVHGWYLKSYVQAMRACRRHGIKLLLRGDSQLATRRSLAKSAAKWLPYRLLLNRADGHLYVGHANKAYLKHYGVSERKLFFVPHSVDDEFFRAGADRARCDGSTQAIRRKFSVPDNHTLALFVGRMISQKRPRDFVDGIADARARHKAAVQGLIVGSGPLEREAQARVRALAAPVHFAGFCNQSALPSYYAAADMLVLPSDGGETWGLVVNEAMACGVPAIVSDAVGCGADLIEEGRTGHLFPLGDVPRLGERVAALHHAVLERKQEIACEVANKISAYSCKASAQAAAAAVDAVCGERS